jgi:transcriptional regulator with XRE-family HTH domain
MRYHFGMRGGDFVLMARRRAGLSQRELAERLGCRQATIARWERDERHPSFEETQAAVRACGFDLAGSIVADDRSWWPQIALQLEQSPSERVRSLTPPGAIDASPALDALARLSVPVIVVGEVAGALQGWPLVLTGTSVVEICGNAETIGPALIEAGFADVNGGYLLPSGPSISLTERPPGTHGSGDLIRGADAVSVETGIVRSPVSWICSGSLRHQRPVSALAKPWPTKLCSTSGARSGADPRRPRRTMSGFSAG